MKAQIMDMAGKKVKDITLPKCFTVKVRQDVVDKVLEAKKIKQPYAPSPVAGKQHSASGTMVHTRKVWKSQYGRGMSRVPRKVMSNKGSQFNWVAAEVSNARGGRRPHPPKVLSMVNYSNINKKEMKLALMSALSATMDGKYIAKRYATLKNEKIENVPLIVESKISSLKTKDLLAGIKNILGEKLFGLAIQKKEIRSGKGKGRGRRYKNNAGLLLVVGKEETVKTTAFDVENTTKLGITALAKGGVGRITVYTENAINELGEKFK